MQQEQKPDTEKDQRRHPRRLLVANSYLMLKRGERYLPPIVRAVLGSVLVGLGFLGFLPILGFWMIPLGLTLIATDIPPFAFWLKQRLRHNRRNKS